MLREPRIDVHVHVLPQALAHVLEQRAEAPAIRSEHGERVVEWGGGIVYPLWREAIDLEAVIERMQKGGIDTSILTVITPSVEGLPAAEGIAVARGCNDELADATRRYPGTLEAVAALPWQAPDAAIAELERAASLGLRGAQVPSNIASEKIDAARFQPVFEAAAQLELPIMLHPAYPLSGPTVDAYALTTTLGFLFDTSTAALRLILGGLFVRHPGFKLYLVHVGSVLPYVLGRLDYEAARYDGAMGALTVPPSEHVKLLYTDSVCVWPPALRLALEVFGEERVMFGTDEPFWQTDRAVAAVDALDLPEAARRRLWSGTAIELFGLREGAAVSRARSALEDPPNAGIPALSDGKTPLEDPGASR
jgi:predicted TIM-barrel fold metal-dependent hydrolase